MGPSSYLVVLAKSLLVLCELAYCSQFPLILPALFQWKKPVGFCRRRARYDLVQLVLP